MTHRRRADRYVMPWYPIDEPPTWRATCECGWAGPERYGTHLTGGVDLPGLDYLDHVGPA